GGRPDRAGAGIGLTRAHGDCANTGRARAFFFQAEDGIRDFHVTGVQTCALPILHQPLASRGVGEVLRGRTAGGRSPGRRVPCGRPPLHSNSRPAARSPSRKPPSSSRIMAARSSTEPFAPGSGPRPGDRPSSPAARAWLIGASRAAFAGSRWALRRGSPAAVTADPGETGVEGGGTEGAGGGTGLGGSDGVFRLADMPSPRSGRGPRSVSSRAGTTA